MQILYGNEAYSPLRLQQLLSQLQQQEIGIQTLQAKYFYLVDEEQALLHHEQKTLERIVHAQLKISVETLQATSLTKNIIVTPRLGTISPWSSKATHILHNCGLSKINRMERGIIYELRFDEEINTTALDAIIKAIHDPMTETVWHQLEDVNNLFLHQDPKPLSTIDIFNHGLESLQYANKTLGLALSEDEINYLYLSYKDDLQREPTDVELMMFAQVNSEHCRHKIFKADWNIDNEMQSQSLMQMIQNTAQKNPQGLITAYHDNAAIIENPYFGKVFFVDPHTHIYSQKFNPQALPMVIKVETHNHPTAIAPFPGAATGSGGEIRDEGATGRGARPKAGLCGFSVSNLQIPHYIQPWEKNYGAPLHQASALDIMLHGPVGAASFNNEFGRPNLCGYFRVFEEDFAGKRRGYHKPIMIAGGLGTIEETNIGKKSIPVSAQIIVLGGPAMKIGLGGGAASSMSAGSSREELDFASVQRHNPEMQRRAQEVINQCAALGAENPIISIHDVGAGGLSNAVPEIIHDSARGGRFELRTIPSDEPGMSPLEIWCNESQERYVLAIKQEHLKIFKDIATRERCPFAVIGETIIEEDLIVGDGYFDNSPIDMPLQLLFGKPPKTLRQTHHHPITKSEFNNTDIHLQEAVFRVLRHPTVASKKFLITIGDRTVGGLTARDQMVGPWQIPVSDVAVTALCFGSRHGEAMSLGERSPIALLHPVASARMAVGEAITNMMAADIDNMSDIKLSANWMAACDEPGEDAGLYDAVKAVGLELCPELGIAIPVGKDSLSMQTRWVDNQKNKSVTSPLSLIISAFAPVREINNTLTPQLQTDRGDTDLIFIDVAKGKQRLGGSTLAQVYNQLGHHPANFDDPTLLKQLFKAIKHLKHEKILLAYHDRSDGGLFATLCEMAFAGHCGINILLNDLGTKPLDILFNEELGVVIQVCHSDTDNVLALLREYDLSKYAYVIGTLNDNDNIEFYFHKEKILSHSRLELLQVWSETSFHLQTLRDNPHCAKQEFDALADNTDPGITAKLTFDTNENILFPYINVDAKPKVAILREQGVNGHNEMAAAFYHAGFECHDVHMSDIIAGIVSLDLFNGMVACGGFSYGDVLGAGQGWAKTILFNLTACEEFTRFFMNPSTFALGVCNGCQMFSHLTEIIPGSQHWPYFKKNLSEQFEARFLRVEIVNSPSLFFKDMHGSIIPVVVSHGEGRAAWQDNHKMQSAIENNLIAMRYVDNYDRVTEAYPLNPNGSPHGITALTTNDGRITLMMPHPERVFLTTQNSWHPKEWGEYSPWMRMFQNARLWLE